MSSYVPWLTAEPGRIYVSGGFDGIRDMASAEAYDPRSNSWNCSMDPMAVPRSYHAMATSGSHVYAIGGWGAHGQLGVAVIENSCCWSHVGGLIKTRQTCTDWIFTSDSHSEQQLLLWELPRGSRSRATGEG
eukprot:Skav230892  [mRNA]  locus=scaffold2765:174696:175815:- [translate_table: standard]